MRPSRTSGLHHLYVTTHDYPGTIALWTAMGFTVEFETDHGSAKLVPAEPGPYVFVDTCEDLEQAVIVPYLAVPAGDPFEGAEATHWGTRVRQITDPDGRTVVLEQQP
jgi:hypothetical protein